MTVSVAGTLTFASVGDGVTTVFNYPVRFLEAADLRVTLIAPDGIETVQQLSTHYTVSGAGSLTGGFVTMLTPPIAGHTIRRERATAHKQIIDLSSTTENPADAVEKQLDRITMGMQDLRVSVDRAHKATFGQEGTVFDVSDIGNAEENAQIALDAAAAAEAALAAIPIGGATGLAVFTAATPTDVTTALGIPTPAILNWIPLLKAHYVVGAEHGMVGDYVSTASKGTDNALPFENAVTAAMAGRKTLLLPFGPMRMASMGDIDGTAGGKTVLKIIGTGSEQSQFVVDVNENTTGAVQIKSISPGQQFHLEMSGFSCVAADSNYIADTPRLFADDMLKIIRDPAPSLRLDNEVILRDLFMGAFGDQQASSKRHYHIKGVRWLRMEYCRAFAAGKSTDSNFRLNTSDQFRVDASLHLEDCWGFYVAHSEFSGGENTVLVDAYNSEGGLLHWVAATGGKVGLRKRGSSDEPGFVWDGGHFNSRDYGVVLEAGRCVTIENLIMYMNDGIIGGGDNPNSAASPAAVLLESGLGTQIYVNNNKMYFLSHKALSNMRFVRSLQATGQVIHLNHNYVNDTGATKMGYFFDSANKQRVFSTGNGGVAEGCTVPWRNGGSVNGEQYRQSNGSRINIYGQGNPNTFAPTSVSGAVLASFFNEAAAVDVQAEWRWDSAVPNWNQMP